MSVCSDLYMFYFEKFNKQLVYFNWLFIIINCRVFLLTCIVINTSLTSLTTQCTVCKRAGQSCRQNGEPERHAITCLLEIKWFLLCPLFI